MEPTIRDSSWHKSCPQPGIPVRFLVNKPDKSFRWGRARAELLQPYVFCRQTKRNSAPLKKKESESPPTGGKPWLRRASRLSRAGPSTLIANLADDSQARATIPGSERASKRCPCGFPCGAVAAALGSDARTQ
eukprot:1092006-Prorocentrum_minimum.AAC.2